MTTCTCGRGCCSPTNFKLIRDEFHPGFGTDDPTEPTIPDEATIELRVKLIFEEFKELIAELGFTLWATEVDGGGVELSKISGNHTYDLEKIAKESADLKVVTYGTDASFGIDADKAFRAVHQSNMTKLTKDGKVLKREDGKILKSDQYKEPDMIIIFD